MQFHLNGFRAGDPEIAAAVRPPLDREALPAEVDVLIVGCGPAGLTLAAQLSAFPEIVTVIVEQKDGPLRLGQADGIACRTMEMFEAFGFADEIARESCWITETVFWKPGGKDGGEIVRHGRVQDVADDLSEMPHVILNQARVHDRYLKLMRNAPRRSEPFYGRRVVRLEREGETEAYPVLVELERTDPGHETRFERVRARYVVGCDGARSVVREAMGLALRGDSAHQAWGVMDVLATTDFPDVRYKAAIQSAHGGNILIIPREGGYLTRFYVELDQLEENERIADRNVTVEQLISTAQRILHPYQLDVKEVAWWSCYVIGQRLCDRFDDVSARGGHRSPRLFIAGDACHTHSPKAGQGMNVSMQDSFNLGWKLAAVLLGHGRPELLETYSRERQAIAKELIDFDREWAAMFSAQPKDDGAPGAEGVDPAELREYFIEKGRFTAGVATQYRASMICGDTVWQSLATGLPVGMRFHSAPVVRLSDARVLQLGHEVKADGRWRLFIFAGEGDMGQAGSPVADLCHYLLNDARSPIVRYTPQGTDIDGLIDVRAIFQASHHHLDFSSQPDLLRPLKGRYRLRDYEKIFCAEVRGAPDIYNLRGIDRQKGCMVLVRPDQYVAQVQPLDAIGQLAGFFDSFLVKQ